MGCVSVVRTMLRPCSFHEGAAPRREANEGIRPIRLTGQSVFERYNIVSECDLVEAAKKLNAFQNVPPAAPAGRLKPAPTTDHDREAGLPAIAARSARRDGGHNLGTVTRRSKSRL